MNSKKPLNINLYGGDFSHQSCSTLNQVSKTISWNITSYDSNISFYADKKIDKLLSDKKSDVVFGWLLEASCLIKKQVRYCINNHNALKKKAKFIFTHCSELLNLDPDFYKFAPTDGTWIKKPKIHDKTKAISFITSNKSYTVGHKKRLHYLNKFRSHVDLYGRGFFEIEEKEYGLNDYMFSICIENDFDNLFFTEKILDCFATGTIPIYLGAKDIGKYFATDGIIFLDENTDVTLLNKNLYLSKLDAINYNYKKVVNEFMNSEDFIYHNYLQNIL